MFSPMLALYIMFLLLTFLMLGVFFIMAKRRFGAGSEHFSAVRNYFRACVKIVSVLSAISILLIAADKIPSDAISYLCIPFFVILAGAIGQYFRVLRHFHLTMGKKQGRQ